MIKCFEMSKHAICMEPFENNNDVIYRFKRFT